MAKSILPVSLFEENENYSYFEGMVTLPAWRDFTSSTHPEFPLVIGEDMTYDEEDGEPFISNEHVAAYQYLIDHQERLRDLLLAEALHVYMAGREDSGYYGEELERVLPVLETPRELNQMMQLGRIHILNVARDGYAYIGFEFKECRWEDEHGLGFIVYKDDIIHTGHASDAGIAHYAIDDKEHYE